MKEDQESICAVCKPLLLVNTFYNWIISRGTEAMGTFWVQVTFCRAEEQA